MIRDRATSDHQVRTRDDQAYRLAADNDDLAHIPGSDGWPYFGKSFRLIFGLKELAEEHYAKYGEVSRVRSLGKNFLMVLGADNFRDLLLDTEQNFSSEMGYTFGLGDFYKGGLLLRDFDDHLRQRRIMQKAFKMDAMRKYVPEMAPIIDAHIARFGDRKPLRIAPAIKETLLDVGAHIFFGVDDAETSEQLNDAFAEIAWGLLSQVKREIPGSAFWRGKRGMRALHRYFAGQIEERRGAAGNDMFTYMCNETLEDENYFRDEDIVAHAAFLLFAAHDTTASTLNNLVMRTAMDLAWQEKLREEAMALGKDRLVYEDLQKLELLDRAFHETIRLYPPVPLGLRRTVRDSEIGGHRVPAHTLVLLPFPFNHRDPRHWSDPETWDPDRFSPERQEHRRHPFAFHPFGGGMHKCIGMHFANMVAKVFMFHFLVAYRYRTPERFEPSIQWLPLPKAVRLPLTLERIRGARDCAGA